MAKKRKMAPLSPPLMAFERRDCSHAAKEMRFLPHHHPALAPPPSTTSSETVEVARRAGPTTTAAATVSVVDHVVKKSCVEGEENSAISSSESNNNGGLSVKTRSQSRSVVSQVDTDVLLAILGLAGVSYDQHDNFTRSQLVGKVAALVKEDPSIVCELRELNLIPAASTNTSSPQTPPPSTTAPMKGESPTMEGVQVTHHAQNDEGPSPIGKNNVNTATPPPVTSSDLDLSLSLLALGEREGEDGMTTRILHAGSNERKTTLSSFPHSFLRVMANGHFVDPVDSTTTTTSTTTPAEQKKKLRSTPDRKCKVVKPKPVHDLFAGVAAASYSAPSPPARAATSVAPSTNERPPRAQTFIMTLRNRRAAT